MKNISIHDVLRSILKHKTAWLLILLIVMLGTMVILGVSGAARGVKLCADDYYEQQNFADGEIATDLLLTPEDLEAIRRTEGVKDVEAVWQTAAKAGEGEEAQDVAIISLTERVSLPGLKEGRLPENGTECAVEPGLCEKMGWQIGDRIQLRGEEEALPRYLSAGEFLIVGIAGRPDHADKEAAVTGYVMVTPGAFNKDTLEGCAMKAEIEMEKETETDRFSEEYKEQAAALGGRLKEMAPERVAMREKVVREKTQEAIDEDQAELDQAMKDLEENRLKLDDRQKELEKDEQKLRSRQEKLPAAKQKLDEEKAALEQEKKELDKSRKDLDAEKKKLEEPKKKLEETRKDLDARKAKLDAQKEDLEDTKSQLAKDKKKLAAGYSGLESEKAKIRGEIRGVIENAYGGDTGSLIAWASSEDADVEDEELNVEEIRISESYRAGTSKSWNQVIEGFVYSSAIPDEVLVQIYRNMKDDPHAEPDLKEVREFLSEQAAGNSDDVEAQYEELQSDSAAWTARQKEYLKACGDYEKSQKRYQEKLEDYKADEKKYAASEKEYKKALSKQEAGEESFAKAEKQYQKNQKSYQTNLEQYEKEEQAVEKSKKSLQKAKKSLEKDEKAYESSKTACEEETKRLKTARDRLKNMPAGAWEITDSTENAGYGQVQKESSRLRGMAVIFAILIPIIGGLGIYAAAGRAALEEKSLLKVRRISTLVKRPAWLKVLLFGTSAALAGYLLGLLLGRFAFEPILLGSMGGRYVFEMGRGALKVGASIAALFGSLLLTVIAVSAACLRPLQKGRIPANMPEEERSPREGKPE